MKRAHWWSVLVVVLATMLVFTPLVMVQGQGQGNTSDQTTVVTGAPDTYKLTILFTDTGGTSGSFKVWVKGDKTKIDITTQERSGDESHQVLIRNEEGDFMYDPEEKTGMKIPDILPQDPFEMYTPWIVYFEYYQTVYTQDAVILAAMKEACANSSSCKDVSIAGHGSVLGEECTIFETTSAQGTKTKVWIAVNKGYPLKVKSTTADDSITTIEYQEVEFSPTIPDSTFEIPPEVEIQDMYNMPGM
jgi:outer membrane lipoprotein-sorting protein